MPILPTVLINGAEGIGTGWSTSIPNYNPRDLVANMKRLLNGEQQVEMQPWYRGFSGSIMEVPSKTAGKSYTLNGVVSQVFNTSMQLLACLSPVNCLLSLQLSCLPRLALYTTACISNCPAEWKRQLQSTAASLRCLQSHRLVPSLLWRQLL